MIELERVSKAYRTRAGVKTILADVSLRFPRGRSVGLLGDNGAGKSTLLRLIAGTELPDRGRITRNVRISWPLGFSGAMHGSLSGIDNARFVARIYGLDVRETIDFVADFAELGPYLEMPVRTYSSGMRARLAFGLSMAVDFECYLVDEITGVGDLRFKRKCQESFASRRKRADIIMVSHSINTLKTYCQSALILDHGAVVYFEDIKEAEKIYGQRSK
jgi:capsular polysaccharide transport system ATP-binding protein